ncbi:MAG TPA: hypothetical protein VMW49_04250 [Candidatus Dormibacteraeota bacterium]|nr:hypothetical protein [Candidatus Dormibacteraeota bacterium]
MEFALGATVFLLLVLGVMQYALLSLTEAGVQADVLAGARAAAGTVPDLAPLANLVTGQDAVITLLPSAAFGARIGAACLGPAGALPPLSCGLPTTCVRWQGLTAQPATAVACLAGLPPGTTAGDWGPPPGMLDGPQNPTCHRGGRCFGAGAGMAACAGRVSAGTLRVCLTYVDWPATAVDVWVRGSVRSIAPLPGRSGWNLLTIDSRLRLQVEQFTA